MGFYDTYKAVFHKVKQTVSAISGIQKTVLGERFKLTSLPLAIINPGGTRIEQAEIGSMLSLTISFDIILVIRETEPEDWFDDILQPMGAVVDAILADRTLAGACKDVKPIAFMPGEIRFTEKVYYGGLITFTAFLFYAP